VGRETRCIEAGIVVETRLLRCYSRLLVFRAANSLVTRILFAFVALIGSGSLCLAANSSPASAAKSTSGSWSIVWQPARPVNGSPILFRVNAPVKLSALSGKWIDHDVFFSFDPKSKTWYGIAGAALDTHPGNYALTLTGETASGKQISWEKSVAVRKGKYRQISVSVAKQFTEPNPDQLKEIKEEQTLKHETFAHSAPEQEWTGNFLPPVTAQISDVFGTARVFNGETQSVHQGLDFAVPTGTPVDALNRGTVILARPLFFEGGCVVLDHGQGLMTIYMHLSRIEVKEGEEVNRKQEIGLSGGTGRATGPHLHVAVRWQGIYLDPATLLKLNLP
jgi:murein DD-endopeptidase MepM/ murein hydrolase activator NlpD